MSQETFSEGRDTLPTNVKPVHYNLRLAPDLETFEFEGEVTIDLKVLKDTQAISVNSLDLKIQKAQVHCQSRSIKIDAKPKYDKEAQTVTIDLEETLDAGLDASITFAFTGILDNNPTGIYRARYQGEDGNDQYMMASQMEPIVCRTAFPCFDEPALKATFDIALTAEKSMTCLSNMDPISVMEHDSGKKTVAFRRTPLMSTYILAFAVGHMNMIETQIFRVPVRTFAVSNRDIEETRFALELGAKTLAFFEKEFGVQFPLPKVDMIAVPGFIGAMENWGLVMYNERILLYNETTSDVSAKKSLVSTLQHELAHQWFGNIVTMDFWDGLWLNEGFATWASLHAGDAFFPDWKVWQGFVTDELQDGLTLDSLRSSHPIEVPIKHASEIGQVFDQISYDKGSSVLRMISTSIGVGVFLKGVGAYLTKHAYRNTKTDDLWAALTEASGRNIEDFGQVWTKNVGHQVVTVTENHGVVSVKQNRFLRTGDVRDDEDQMLYPIFLNVRTLDGVDSRSMLTERESTIHVPIQNDFFKVNANHVGFYRTLYSPDRLLKLGESKALLSPEDRAGLISDTAVLSSAGYNKTSVFLQFMEKFGGDSNYSVWKQTTSSLSSVHAAWAFENEKVITGLLSFQRKLVGAKAHELGWQFNDQPDENVKQFMALMFAAAARAGDQRVTEAAFDMFGKFKSGDRAALHPSIRTPVFAVVLTHGNDIEENYQTILQEYRNAKAIEDRQTALRALGSVRKPALIRQTLAFVLGDEVQQNDAHYPFDELVRFQEGIVASWNWLKENYPRIEKKIFPGLVGPSRLLRRSIWGFTSEDRLKEVQAFFENKSTSSFDMLLEQNYDEVRVKSRWVERDREDVKEWLAERNFE